MQNTAILVSLVCAGILIYLSARRTRPSFAMEWSQWLVTGAALLGGWGAFAFESLGPWRLPVSGALFGFGACALLLGFPDSDEPAALAPGLLFAAAFVHLFAPPETWDSHFLLAALTGAAGAAGWQALRQRSISSGAFAVLGALGWGATVLGRDLAVGEARQSVLNLIAIALFSILIGEALTVATKKQKFAWPRWATALLFGVMAFFVVVKTMEFPDLPVAVGGSALVAVALYAVHRGKPTSTAMALVGGLVWLGVATASFSFARGYGIALTGLVGLCATWISGERRVAVWISPLIALTIYRLARQLFPDASRAFDIGQHYALVGLFIGVFLPLLLAEWGRELGNRKPVVALTAAVCAGLSTLIGLASAVGFLGAKGASGLLIGCLASPLVSTLKGEPNKTALSTGVGLACWVTVCIGTFSTEEDLARPDKVKLLLTVGLIVMVLAVAASLLARQKKENQPA